MNFNPKFKIRSKPLHVLKKIILNKKAISCFLLATLFQLNTNAETNHNLSFNKINLKQSVLHKVRGLIKDEKGLPMPGVSVKVKGTNVTTVTDNKGQFSITTPDEASKLLVSFVGYTTQEVSVDGKAELNIVLREMPNSLNDVVVVGYGTTKTKNLTTSISRVKAEDLDVGTTSNFQQTLQGKAPGVQVMQATGQPGAGATIQIRSNPSNANAGVLYVVDGVPVNDAPATPLGNGYYANNGGVDQSPLNFINPNDIESIDFLKDASAASIYGARAGAGVVLITTKKGVSGKSKINYSGTYGIQDVDKMYPVMGPKDFANFSNSVGKTRWYSDNGIAPYYGTKAASAAPAYVPVYTQAQINALEDRETATDAITRAGYTQQHNLSVSGGNGKTNYVVSGNMFDQKGVILASGFKRYNGRVAVDQAVSDKIRVGGNVIFSNSTTQNSVTGGQYEQGGIITAAIYYPGNLPLRDANGGYPVNPFYGVIPNPLSYETLTDKTTNARLLTYGYADWDILPELKAKISGSYDQGVAKRTVFWPTTFLYGAIAKGSASISDNSSKTSLMEYSLSYNKTFALRHQVSAVAGYSYNKNVYEGLYAANANFFSDAQSYYNLGAGQSPRPTVGSNKGEKTWASYFARVNYILDEKYALQASLRRDGASNFAENQKWGYFPSVSASWLISDEKFIKTMDKISMLKLRVGYGETGNSNFSGSAFEQYGTDLSTYFGQTEPVTGISIRQAANPNLTWETVGEFNAGLDFGLFNNRLTGSVDYFNKTISNLINYVKYPSGFIIDGVYANSGSTKSVGYEFGIQSKNFVAKNKGGFTWSTSLNFSHYLSYWKERDEIALKVLDKYLPVSGKDAIFRPIIGYQGEGIFRGEYKTQPSWSPGTSPGSILIRDVNGYDAAGNLTGKPDGVISVADQSIIGNLDPKFNFGIGNTFTYKNFDLNIFMSGAKQERFDVYSKIFASTILSSHYNTVPQLMDSWSPDNVNGALPSVYISGEARNSTFSLVDASYLRCKNITLGYSFPEKLLSKQKIFKNLRLSFDMQNAFTITNYPILDPELDMGNLYPLVKSYVFGLNASF